MRARDVANALGRLARALVPIVGLSVAIATVAIVPRSGLATTHSGGSIAAEATYLAAGLALTLVGVLVSLDRPGSTVGPVATLAGVAWFAPDWVGWGSAPPVARSAAMVAEPFLLPLVFHLVVAQPGRRPRSTAARAAIPVLYGVAAAVSLGQAAFRDPFLDPYCWSNCRDNVFLITPLPAAAATLHQLWLVTSLAAGAGLATGAAWELATATRTARRARAVVLIPGILLGAEAAAHSIALFRQALEHPADPVLVTLFFARGAGCLALALGLGVALLRARRARLAVDRLAADLGAAPPPGSLGAALARATGDPTIEVVYPLPGDGGYVDASGRSMAPPTSAGRRAATSILMDGREAAVVLHDAAAVDAAQLRNEIGAAARLAIENERLQAGVLAQLEALRASRIRIVEAGDAERRRLERNLHDGVQQRLLALAFDLRLARAAAAAGPSPHVGRLLATAADETAATIDELREVAQGIYLAVVTEAGIGPALASLTDTTDVAVDVVEAPGARFPEAVERTAFIAASEGIDSARVSGSSPVGVRAFRQGRELVVEVDGVGPDPFVHLADRVGALGGRLHAEERRLRVEIPCV